MLLGNPFKGGFDKIASSSGMREKNIFDEFDEACTMSRTHRMYGFGICFGLGMILSFLSTLVILNPRKFAILFTFGNILSIFSTAFLIGPMSQVRNMLANKRIVATGIYVLCMVLTLVAALKIKSVILTLIFLVFQFLALVWYVASYIPGGQAILASLCKGAFTPGQ